MEMNMFLLLATGLIPLIVGFIWYHPNVFGNAWMKSINMTEEQMKGTNMLLVFGLCYVFGVMISLGMTPVVIHQMGFMSVLADEPSINDKASDISLYAKNFYDTYGTRFRTFKHGSFHGFISAVFVALPIIGTIALFERRSFKNVAIHVGFWMVTLALIGGVICQFI